MTTCRTNCEQDRNNLKHNKRPEQTKSKGFQSLFLASQGIGKAKGNDIACLLRIKLRPTLTWRAELIRVPSDPPEGLMLLLSIFFPKATSAVLPVALMESVQYQFHWPCRKPPTSAWARWQTMPDPAQTGSREGHASFLCITCAFQAAVSIQRSQWEAKRLALSDQEPKVGYLCSCKPEGPFSRLLIVQSHRWQDTALSRPNENSNIIIIT